MSVAKEVLSELNHYREYELSQLPMSVEAVFMIPVRNELSGLRRIIESLSVTGLAERTAVIILLNDKSDDQPSVVEGNRQILDYLKSFQGNNPDETAHPHIRFAYASRMPNRVHFGNLRREIIRCGQICEIQPEAVCFLYDADTPVKPQVIEEILAAYRQDRLVANVAPHDLTPLVVSDERSRYLLGKELNEFSVSLLTDFDTHRFLDAVTSLYLLLLTIDSYETNTPAISAKFSWLQNPRVLELLAQHQVAEDHALAGWFRRNVKPYQLGNYGRVLYGNKARVVEDTHHGDAEERSYLEAYLRGGGITVDFNPLRDFIYLRSLKERNSYSLEHVASIMLNVKPTVSEAGEIDEESYSQLVEAIYKDIPGLRGIFSHPEFGQECDQMVISLCRNFQVFMTELTRAHRVVFQDRFIPAEKRRTLFGVNNHNLQTPEGVNALGRYLTLNLIKDLNGKDDEPTNYPIPDANVNITERMMRLAALIAQNSGHHSAYDAVYNDALGDEIAYEQRVLKYRRRALRAFVTKQNQDAENYSQAKPFFDLLGREIRRYFEGAGDIDSGVSRLPPKYQSLVVFTELHHSIARVAAIRRASLATGLALIK